jgi:outer membrane lipopolysaccharide assembly protein LptE/RlpB
VKRIFFLLLAALLCFECGYHLRGTGSSLPSHIKKVSIPMFKNRTTRYELDVKLTRSVIDEFVARGVVEVTSDDQAGDAVLSGEIISFRVNPIGFTGEATADRYNIIVVAKIVLRDLAKQRVIYSNPSFVYQEEYEVPEGTDFETVETDAVDKIAEKFARSVVITILEGF